MNYRQCFVYVVGISGGAHVKIGITANPSRRLVQLQHANAEVVSILALRSYSHREIAAQVEARTHVLLADKRMHGEWFAVTAEEAAYAVDEARKWVGRRRKFTAPNARRSVHLRVVR